MKIVLKCFLLAYHNLQLFLNLTHTATQFNRLIGSALSVGMDSIILSKTDMLLPSKRDNAIWGSRGDKLRILLTAEKR